MFRKFAVGITIISLLMAGAILMGAEKPKGVHYADTYSWEMVPDSTVARQVDTFTVWTGSTGKLFRCDYPADYSKLYMRYMVEYTYFDTTTGGVVVDTTDDSVLIQLYTADQALSAYKLVFIDTIGSPNMHATAAVVNADYLYANLSDSVLLDNVYIQIISILRDSVYVKARQSVGLTYKAHVDYWLK
jgi:hypothetical protein